MNNELRISYSSSTCFKACPEKHYLSYILGCRPKEEGASLSFGIAVDEAIGMLLRAKRDNQELPKLEQVQNEFLFHSEKGFEQHFDSMKLRYTKADVDPKVFNQEDWATISLFEKELHCSMEEARKAFNQKSFKKMSSDEDRMYSRLGFLSLKAKGKLMIEAFYKEVLPEIEEVVAVQHKFEGEIGGYKLIGYLDLIAKMKGYEKPIVLDLKTAAVEYEWDSIQLSDQLLTYLLYVGKDLDTHLAGFIVLLKGISTDIFCSKCGTPKTSNHKTCPIEINGKRCGAEWTEKPKAKTQILIDEVTDKKLERFEKDLGNITSIMGSGLRYKNFGNCKEYGMCNFFGACHKNDLDSVIWRSEEDKQTFLKGE